ncbi:S-adenosylmethionine tRNA ribosyltransferase [Lewinellaceae bacterium SD302]|nr:S-adenosylmethionine tRNA ribosyltransferase [Lewinellaceae bacterium SD302]
MSGTSAREFRIEDFTYELPDDRIARHPLAERDAAKLLHYHDGMIDDHHFWELPELLPPGTLLVGNATRVIHARLHFELPNGRQIEIFCLDPLEPVDYQRNFSASGSVVWKCLVGGNRRWKDGVTATLNVPHQGDSLQLRAERLGRTDNTFEIRFSWEGAEVAFGPLLDAAGEIPLPPYLGRDAEEDDKDRYQTVFAEIEGSVAAPTAGLHLSERLMAKMRDRNLNWGEVILHVGAGTFKPVTSDTLGGHEMHREYFEVDLLFLERLLAQLRSGQPIVSVGTTTTRCMESIYYFGSKLAYEADFSLPASIDIGQWVATERSYELSPAEAVQALIDRMQVSGRKKIQGNTQLIITPDLSLRMVDGIITNFHQPNSTLLLIVAATVGQENWKSIYRHALTGDYRFLSYGDGSLLWKHKG